MIFSFFLTTSTLPYSILCVKVVHFTCELSTVRRDEAGKRARLTTMGCGKGRIIGLSDRTMVSLPYLIMVRAEGNQPSLWRVSPYGYVAKLPIDVLISL